jgi:hypothetical protein
MSWGWHRLGACLGDAEAVNIYFLSAVATLTVPILVSIAILVLLVLAETLDTLEDRYLGRKG